MLHWKGRGHRRNRLPSLVVGAPRRPISFSILHRGETRDKVIPSCTRQCLIFLSSTSSIRTRPSLASAICVLVELVEGKGKTIMAPDCSTAISYRLICGFTRYRVGDDGSVWSIARYRSGRGDWYKMVPQDCRGYARVQLHHGGKVFDRKVHHLVLEAFIGPRPPGMQSCHSPDPNRRNNSLNNLRWDTPQANSDDQIIDGTRLRGSEASGAKLDEKDIPVIRQLLGKGISRKEIGREFGVSCVAIGDIARRKSWSHV